jgi:hypothetical protein
VDLPAEGWPGVEDFVAAVDEDRVHADVNERGSSPHLGEGEESKRGGRKEKEEGGRKEGGRILLARKREGMEEARKFEECA